MTAGRRPRARPRTDSGPVLLPVRMRRPRRRAAAPAAGRSDPGWARRTDGALRRGTPVRLAPRPFARRETAAQPSPCPRVARSSRRRGRLARRAHRPVRPEPPGSDVVLHGRNRDRSQDALRAVPADRMALEGDLASIEQTRELAAADATASDVTVQDAFLAACEQLTGVRLPSAVTT